MDIEMTATVQASAKRRKKAWRQDLEGYLFASPWLIGFVVFTVGPMIVSLFLSFTNYCVFLPLKWVGLGNYAEMFTRDEYFPKALYNTAYYSFLTVLCSQPLALSLALLMNRDLPGIRLFRAAFYLPRVTSGVALSMLFIWILDPHVGFVNNALRAVGLPAPLWLQSPQWSKPGLVLMSLFGVGHGMVIYLAALQDVPQELMEAASIDGASRWRRFWSITIPMISPTLLFQLIMATIATFQVFSSAYVMTEGGPLNSTLFYVLYLYRQGFEYLNMGYASALAWFLFIVLVLLTALIFRSSSAWVYYEGRRGS
jgi:multiple sugar transport system permease protein